MLSKSHVNSILLLLMHLKSHVGIPCPSLASAPEQSCHISLSISNQREEGAGAGAGAAVAWWLSRRQRNWKTSNLYVEGKFLIEIMLLFEGPVTEESAYFTAQ